MLLFLVVGWRYLRRLGRGEEVELESTFLERGWVGKRLILFSGPPFHLLSLLLDDLRGMPLSPGVGSSSGPPGDLEDDEGLKHLQQV